MMEAPAISDLCNSAASLFRTAFGASPGLFAQAPGRVNLIGEHVDYNAGIVVPMAIDRWCVVAGGLREDHRWEAVSDGHAEPLIADLSTAATELPPGDWRRYALGVLALVAERFGASRSLPGLNLAIVSSVPPGAGLSSSAALETAIGVLAARVWSAHAAVAPPDALTLARICQRAEHEYAHVPCGLMDQLVSVAGVENAAIRIDCREESWKPVLLPPEMTIVVCDSGVKHALAGTEYAARRAACRRACTAMGVASLRDVSPWQLRDAQSLLDPEAFRCARHVVDEIIRADAFVHALRHDDLPVAGELMLASHESLRRDYRVSCPELDALVDEAMQVEGVFGARMTGAGFGGSIVAICRGDAAPGLIRRAGEMVPGPSRAFAPRAAASASIINPERGTDHSAIVR